MSMANISIKELEKLLEGKTYKYGGARARHILNHLRSFLAIAKNQTISLSFDDYIVIQHMEKE